MFLHFFPSAIIGFCLISRSVKGKFGFDISVEQLNSNSDNQHHLNMESIWHKILLFLKKKKILIQGVIPGTWGSGIIFLFQIL